MCAEEAPDDALTPAALGGRWPPGVAMAVASSPMAGGAIGRTWRATLADGSDVVVKLCPYPAELEAEGFGALARAGVPTPAVLGTDDGLLVTTHVQGPPDWVGLGAAIAGMHQVPGPGYGWHRDNRSGRFVQHNGWVADWPDFFVRRRIRPHLDDPTVPDPVRERLMRACDGPIQALLPKRPAPVLTHGDLWTGNIVAGRWVIDPEVSYGDRELDLVTLLSPTSPVPPAFWSGYTAVLPFPDGFDHHRLVVGLHHRLLGVRHFGHAFVPRLEADLDRLGW